MANNLYITEYGNPPISRQATQMTIASEPVVAEQVITYSTATQSSVFNPATCMVRLHNDGGGSAATPAFGNPCAILFGTNPTAVSGTNRRMAGSQTEYFWVGNNSGLKLSVVSTT